MRSLLGRLIPIIAAVVVGATISVLAANTTFFTSIGDLVFPFSPPPRDGSAGTIDNMTIGATTPRAGTFTTLTANVVNAALGAYAANPASESYYPVYTFGNNQTLMTFNTGGVAYAYFRMPASPKDGQQACLFSTGAITNLFVYANTGQSIVNAATTLAANTKTCYAYSLSNTTWYRSQ